MTKGDEQAKKEKNLALEISRSSLAIVNEQWQNCHKDAKRSCHGMKLSFWTNEMEPRGAELETQYVFSDHQPHKAERRTHTERAFSQKV